MPIGTTLAILASIAGITGAGVGIGEDVSSSNAEKKALSTTPTLTPTPPAPITAPTAPQISAAANNQFLTGGGTGAAPDYLSQLLSGSGATPSTELSALQGYLS